MKDNEAFKPDSNLQDVVKDKLSEGQQYKNLIIQTGSVDITNIDTYQHES